MSTVEEGHTVVLHYTGTLADGKVFDSSREGSPMEVRIGAGQVVPGFESGIMGMEVGETRTFTIAPKDAYGEHDEDLWQRVEKERFPDPEPEQRRAEARDRGGHKPQTAAHRLR